MNFFIRFLDKLQHNKHLRKLMGLIILTLISCLQPEAVIEIFFIKLFFIFVEWLLDQQGNLENTNSHNNST